MSDILNDSTLVWLLCCGMMFTAFIPVLITTWAAERRLITPVTAFLAFAVCHAIAGRITGPVTAFAIGRAGDAIEYFLNEAFLIVSLPIFIGCLTYVLIPLRLGNQVLPVFDKLTAYIARPQDVRIRSFISICLAIVLIFIGLTLLGGIPLLQEHHARTRLMNVFKPSYGWTAFITNRGRDLVQLPAAFLTIILLRSNHTRWANILMIGLALLGCALLVQRTPIINIVVVIAMAVLIRGSSTRFILIGAGVVTFYVATQFALELERTNTDRWLFALGNGLPELRDLAYVLSVNPPDPLNGLTFLVGLLPAPGFVSDFTSSYLIRTITLQSVNIPLDAPHGGLRITCAGEWYLNFRYTGVVISGVLLGILCAIFRSLFIYAAKARSLGVDLLLASLWMMFGFEVYLSGTGIAGMVKSLLIILFLLLINLKPLRSRRPRQVFPGETTREAVSQFA